MMNFIKCLWHKIEQWFRPQVYKSTYVEELPDSLKSNKVYLVGENQYFWYASMLCPCGCQEILYMNLLPDERPQWLLTEHKNGAITLHPSIWRIRGCKSHFFLRKGKIHWCQNYLRGE